MPRLNCSASTCSYNNSNYCCKNQINVGGENATNVSATCCESFAESNGAFTNSAQTPNTYLSISCDADNCVHNCNHNCEAESISVAGAMANAVEETQCSSFICK